MTFPMSALYAPRPSIAAPPEQIAELFEGSQRERLRAVAVGPAPDRPITSHIGLGLVFEGSGEAVMTAKPDESHHNPIGSVHAGIFATIPDSVRSCTGHGTLAVRVGYTGPGIEMSFLGTVSAGAGPGWAARRGRNDRVLAATSALA